MNTTTNTKQLVVDRPRFRWGWLVMLVLLFSVNGLFAQAAGGNTNGFNLNIGMNMPEEPQRIDTASARRHRTASDHHSRGQQHLVPPEIG